MTVILAVLAPFVSMAVIWVVGTVVFDIIHAETDPEWAKGDVSQFDRWDGVDMPGSATAGQATRQEGEGR